MSRKVKEWLSRLRVVTTHEERMDIDREIERRKRMNCDDAIEKRMISRREFLEIVALIKRQRKRKREAIAYVV